MTPLRQRMIEDLKLRNLASRTIEVYVQRVAAFARHFGKSPEHLGPPEVRSYLVHLVQEKHVSWSYYNQTVAALRFLYRVTLGRDEALHRIACPQAAQETPRRPQPRGSGPLLPGRPQPQAPRVADDRVCRRAADLGGGGPQGRG
ncbi:MAG TPA: site-specific integrase, partial [Isosphaeraceae bacterium]|nr:site-specific integrase [Isosphaeraceae bacterium]